MRYKRKRGKEATVLRTVIIAVVIVGAGAYGAIRLLQRTSGPDPRLALAECLTEKGTKMYGAYWCPHCARQKKLFGKAFSMVDYVECAIPGSRTGQTQECQDANITGYPTWVFPDGSRASGELGFDDLAQGADCPWGETEAP